jgi:hypothetical protein
VTTYVIDPTWLLGLALAVALGDEGPCLSQSRSQYKASDCY